MGNIDFVVSIVVRLALAVGGVNLLFGGVTGLQADLMMSQVLGGTPFAPMGQFFIVHGAMAAGGLCLLVYAALALMRTAREHRVDQERPAATGRPVPLTTGRIVSALVFGAGAVFGLVTLVPAAIPMTEVALFSAFGIATEATVEDIEPAATPGSDQLLHYTFATPDGEEVRGVLAVGSGVAAQAARTERLGIRYMPGNPQQVGLDLPSGVQSAAFFLATRLGLILVGIWGVWKNLRRGPGGDGDPQEDSMADVPPPMPNRPVPPAPLNETRRWTSRRVFGRRSS